MSTQWRTVQQFISASNVGVFEVEMDTETKETRCNCPVWEKKTSCKHVAFVNNKINTRGHYAITVPLEVPEELAIVANESPETFREFVVHYAKIEVL